MTDIESIKKVVDPEVYVMGPGGYSRTHVPVDVHNQLQAKYNALLRKFIGDSTLVIDGDTQIALRKDIDRVTDEKSKRNAEVASIRQELRTINATELLK